MKLDELIGIKKYSNAGFNPDDKQYPNQVYLGPENINVLMSHAGWYILGKGQSGAVFEKSGKNYVLKIFRDDQPYKIFLKFIMLNKSNPHLPKVGKILTPFKEKDIHVIQLEKLEKYSKFHNSNIMNLSSYIMHYINNYGMPDDKMIEEIYDGNEYSDKKIASIIRKLDDTNAGGFEVSLSLFNLLFKIAKFGLDNGLTENAMDLNSGNIMLRGKTEVIIDPYYEARSSDIEVTLDKNNTKLFL